MSNEVDPTRVIHKLQLRLSEALLTISILETRLEDLSKLLQDVAEDEKGDTDK